MKDTRELAKSYGYDNHTVKCAIDMGQVDALEELSQRIQVNSNKINLKVVQTLIQELIEEIKKS